MSPYGNEFKSTNQRRYMEIEEKKISGYIIDGTMIKAGAEFIWLWIAVEPKNKEILYILYLKRWAYVCYWKVSIKNG